MTTESPVRRSTRSRRPAHSVYDDARASLDSERSSSKKKQRRHTEGISDDSEADEVLSVASSSSEEEPRPKRKRAPKRASPSKTPSSKPRKIATKKKPSRKNAQAALTSLAKKILLPEETAENSLMAALLTNKYTGSRNSMYTEALQPLAHQLVQDRECITKVLLWLFRSVGGKGTVAEDVDLETCSENELGDVLTAVVEEMEVAQVALFEATPQTGAGLREYRTIFQEFCYQLGRAAAQGTKATLNDTGDSDTDDDGESKATGEVSVELARDILSRLTDLVNVGILDLRAAATTAVFQMGTAILDHTVELHDKISTAERQLKVAQRNKQARKKRALSDQIQGWKKQVGELEDIVESIVVSVFLKRYKDVNQFIRSYSIEMLSKFCCIRPDTFLQNSFLKYMGWLLSDTHETVREAAVRAFLKPLQTLDDCQSMSNAIEKFLPRLCDCVLDINDKVQEATMELLVLLLKQGYLDHVEDDTQWDQINLRALAPDASPVVRYHALLFVLEQLDCFDPTQKETENVAVERINAIVDWITHNLIDSDIPIEQVRYELTDLVVKSLRRSDEHQSLVCDWSAMMSALNNETRKTAAEDDDDSIDEEVNPDTRANSAKQRVLLRLIVCAAELEANSEECVASEQVDDELVHLKDQQEKKGKTSTSSHEELTLSLLDALPDLLIAYKTETSVLASLSRLPQYFLPSVFNLSSRKKDFVRLVKNLSEVFLESTDNEVLANCAMALSCLSKGDHSRTKDAYVALKSTQRSLQSRLSDLLAMKVKQDGSKEDDDVSMGSHNDQDLSLVSTQQSISLCLRRLKILSKRVYPGELLVESNDTAAQDKAVEVLFNTVSEYLAKELVSRQLIGEEVENEDDESVYEVPEIWEKADKRLHPLVADAVCDGLSFLLCVTAWRLNMEIKMTKEDDPDGGDIKDHIVLRMRQYLEKLTVLCYEHYFKGNDAASFSTEHVEFSKKVQTHAGRIVGDVRSMFPIMWSQSSSPFLVACANVGEHHSITGGLLRFLADQESELRACETSGDENSAAEDLLLPLARGLALNWKKCNRREAGAALGHIIGSGEQAKDVVDKVSKIFKKIDSVRLLEAQMACICQSFSQWYEAEPEELESDRPTDEELAAFEKAEEKHKKMFEDLEGLAKRLSAALGVGRIKDEKVKRALRGFLKEGIRFAFSTDSPDGEYPVGSRLAFLRVLSKYLQWTKRDQETKQALRVYLDMKETELRRDPEYNEILDEDKEALKLFRETGKLGAFVDEDDQHTAGSFEEQMNTQTSVASSRRPRSTPGSAGSSVWSKKSGVASLPTVHEDDGSDEDEDTGSPRKRRRLSLADSVSTAGRSKESIREGSDEGSQSD